MFEKAITFPEVGYRVLTIHGLHQHGPMEGPKTDVPADTGGQIVGTEKPYYTYDFLLYGVRWDSGQHTKHYFQELLCIGPFRTVVDFKQAVLTDGERAELKLGPAGGFREFSMHLRNRGSPLLVRYTQEQKEFYDSLVAPLVQQAGLAVEVKQMERKKRTVRRV